MLHCIAFAFLLKITWLYLMSLFELSILFHWFVCEVKYCWCQNNFVLFLQHCIGCSGSFAFDINFIMCFSISINMGFGGFLLWLHLIYTSSWEGLNSWQYWVFLSINMKYLSSLVEYNKTQSLYNTSFPMPRIQSKIKNKQINYPFWVEEIVNGYQTWTKVL